MTEADVALASLPQADGRIKSRPVVLLRQMPSFADWLVCGVSTQMRQVSPSLDDQIAPSDSDFRASGLKAASVIRLGVLAVLPASKLMGSIGAIAPERHRRLL